MVMVDIDMCSFTYHIRNGLYLDPLTEDNYAEDNALDLLGDYLLDLASEFESSSP